MTKLTISKIIQASPEKIFAFVISERMNEVWGEWMIGKWDSKEPVGVGSVGHFDTRGMLANFGKMTGTVTDFELNKKMTMHSVDAKGKMGSYDTMLLEPTATGTKTTYITQYDVPYSVFGKLIGKVKIRKDMEAMHVKMLENLKRITLEFLFFFKVEGANSVFLLTRCTTPFKPNILIFKRYFTY